MTWRTNINKYFPLLLVIISSLLIFYQFPSLPRNLSFDEIEFAKLALSLQNSTYIPYSNLATGHSTLYFYLLLLSLKTFGITNFALRLPAAVFGIANVLLIYFVLRKSFDLITEKKVNLKLSILSFMLSLVFLTAHWYFNFTRFSFEVTFLIFLELLSILFLLKFSESKHKKYILLSGIFAGLSYLSYTPGRLFFIVPATYFFIILKQRRELKSILYFFIPFIFLVLPLTVYLFKNPDIRIAQVTYLSKTDLTVAEKLIYFGNNLVKTAGMFFIQGDLNGRQNYPGKAAINPVLGIMFLGGLFWAMKKIQTFPNYLFILYFLISLFPTLLTNPQENPHMLRTITAIVSVIYFIGVALIELEKRFKKHSRLFWIVVLTLSIVSIIYELRTYFVYQASVFPEAFEYYGELSELIYKLPVPGT